MDMGANKATHLRQRSMPHWLQQANSAPTCSLLFTLPTTSSFSCLLTTHSFFYNIYLGLTQLSLLLKLSSIPRREKLCLSSPPHGLQLAASPASPPHQEGGGKETNSFQALSLTSTTKRKTGSCCYAARPRAWPALEKPQHRHAPQSSTRPTNPCPSRPRTRKIHAASPSRCCYHQSPFFCWCCWPPRHRRPGGVLSTMLKKKQRTRPPKRKRRRRKMEKAAPKAAQDEEQGRASRDCGTLRRSGRRASGSRRWRWRIDQ